MDSAVLSLKWPAFIRTSELQHYFKGAFITACELASGRCRPLPDAQRDHFLLSEADAFTLSNGQEVFRAEST